MEANTLIRHGVPLLFMMGFALGYFGYRKYGWKPKGDLTENNKDFLTVTAYACGFAGGFTTLAIGVMLFMAFI